MILKNVFLTDDWQLIVEFNNSTFRLLNCKDLKNEYLLGPLSFQLKKFNFSENEIKWKNGKSIDLKTFIEFSKKAELKDIQYSKITIGIQNQAPTIYDTIHHVYYVLLCPFNKNKPFIIGEHIGSGLDDSGGCSQFSIKELIALSDWKKHFTCANCDWAIEIIEKYQNDSLKVIELIAERSRL